MFKLYIIIILFYFSIEDGIFRKSVLSRHGEDCVSHSACEEGLKCKLNRCMTPYETLNLNKLGLFDKNICNIKQTCKKDEYCYKHRCISKNITIEKPTNSTDKETDIELLFAGSIYLNKRPYFSGVKANGTLNYDHLFSNISADIKNADLSIISQETVFKIVEGKEDFKKKVKNTPKELGDAIANAGFNVVLHASDKSYNLGAEGINNTLKFWKKNHPNIHPLGIASTLEESENDYYIYKKDNLTISMINLCTELEEKIPKDKKFMVNCIINKTKVELMVKKLKKITDFVIVCINWGEKDGKYPNNNQLNWAKLLAGYGVDLIIGNHPVLIQPVAFVRANNGNKALVFFSLGALVIDNEIKFSSLGALTRITVSKGDKKAYLSSYSLTPTINHYEGDNIYKIFKLSDYSEELGKKRNKKFSLEKIKKGCIKVMGSFGNCD